MSKEELRKVANELLDENFTLKKELERVKGEAFADLWKKREDESVKQWIIRLFPDLTKNQ